MNFPVFPPALGILGLFIPAFGSLKFEDMPCFGEGQQRVKLSSITPKHAEKSGVSLAKKLTYNCDVLYLLKIHKILT